MTKGTAINIVSILGAVIGLKQISDGQDDNAAAEAVRSEAWRIHDASISREARSRSDLGTRCDELDAYRQWYWTDLLLPFADALGRIRRVEFTRSDTACEPRPVTSWTLPLDEGLAQVAESPLPAGIGGVGASIVAGVSTVGVASLFGEASTGRPIRALRGAARESAREAWLGGGPRSRGGGGRRAGVVTPYAAAVGAGLFVGGQLYAAQAAEGLAVARQDLARAQVEAGLLDAQSAQHDHRRRIAEQYLSVLQRLHPRAVWALAYVRALTAQQGTDYAAFGQEQQRGMHQAVETVRALKQLLSVRLWTSEGSESHEARALLDDVSRRFGSTETT